MPRCLSPLRKPWCKRLPPGRKNVLQRLVYGLQPVREAIRAHGARLACVYVEQGTSPALRALERFAIDNGIRVERVGRDALERMTSDGRHQGVAADAPALVFESVEDLIVSAETLLAIALDEVQDPQNFGAVLRSAVALAGAAVLWGEHGSAPLSPATFRASAGAIEHARLVRVRSLRGALTTLTDAGVMVVALDASGTQELSEVDLRGPTTLVIGSEGKGLRKGVRAAASVVAKLPMAGSLDSLNASVAAALGLYEAIRQRREINEKI